MLYVHRVNCVIHSSSLNSFLFFHSRLQQKKKKHKEMPVTKQEAHLLPSLGWVLVKEIKFFLGLHCSHC